VDASSGKVLCPSAAGPADWQGINTAGEEVRWTYDVEWVPSDVPWASRWDIYLGGSPDDKIHWFSIINSLMIVLFLTGMVAMIMMRTLYRDIARYNDESAEEAQEETGWKLVHGDVFRPPQSSPLLLSVFVGSGVQILAMTLVLMVFALLGFLSPANRGGLMTAMLLLFVMMGYCAGYVSSRLYKMFGGKQWRQNIFLTAVLFPGVAFSVFFVVNLFVWRSGSSGAVPFTTMFMLLVLWFGISFPLAAVGSSRGFRMDEIKNPTRFNQIPRQIPE
jgi:transmembrane 9 superfamily protein 2/4